MIIAQITDTHIKAEGKLAYRKVDSAKALGDCVDHVNRLEPRPDVVIMTGDLADVGRPSEYAVFRRIVDRLAMPYFVIPGNHDERGAFRQAFADHPYLPSDGDFLHYAIEDYPIRLIGLDTTQAVAESMYSEFKEPLYASPAMLSRMVEAGLLGRKTGRGFYDYSAR